MNRSLAVWLLLGVIWGATWLFIKLGLEDLPPFTFAAIRFLVAVIPLIVLMRLRRVALPPRSEWPLLIGTGMLSFPLGYGLVFWGERHISCGLTAILFTSFPLFGLVLAHVFLPAEPMTARRTAGVILGVSGVALIFSDQLGAVGSAALAGAFAITLSAASSALASVLIKKHGGRIDPLAITVVQMVVGVVPMLGLGVVLEGSPLALHWTPKALISLGYLAFVGSSLAFVLWYWLIQRIEVTKAQLLPLVNTLVAVVLGVLVLDERLAWRELSGGSLILVGLWLSVSGQSSAKQKR